LDLSLQAPCALSILKSLPPPFLSLGEIGFSPRHLTELVGHPGVNCRPPAFELSLLLG
jgi:hypothetical protein